LKGQLYDGSTRLYDAETGTEPIAMYSFAGLAEYAVVPETAAFLLPPLLAESFGYGVFQVWMVYPLVIQKCYGKSSSLSSVNQRTSHVPFSIANR
jgi:hypothetical protein